MNRIILAKARRLLGLAHQHQDTARPIEQRVARPLVRLPRADEVLQTLLEEHFVDLDVCHGCKLRRRWQRGCRRSRAKFRAGSRRSR